MKRSKSDAYTKYVLGQISLSVSEDDVLLLASHLVKAKDEDGLNLFWDESEERFMRDYIEDTEECVTC